MTGRHQTFDWYFTTALACITGLLFCAGIVFNIVALIVGEDFMPGPAPGQSIQPFGGLVVVVVIAVFWFWIRMLTDYFRNRPEKHAVAWGWALVMLNFGAALAYFWLIWRPRSSGRLNR